MNYTEDFFRQLVSSDPGRLAKIIREENLKPSQLTFAVEIFGEIEDSPLVIDVLLPMLDHDSALVREGVIYGLSEHLTKEVKARLKDIAYNDSSMEIRNIALQLLDLEE